MKKVKYSNTPVVGNLPSSLITYKIEDLGFSSFSLKKEKIAEIMPELLTSNDFIEISDNDFNKLVEAHDTQFYRNIKVINPYTGKKITVQVDKGTKKEVLNVIIEAFQNNQPFYFESKKGYGAYPSEEDEENGAIYSQNGEAHILHRIGISTGVKKIFLEIETAKSFGGGRLSTSSISKAVTHENIAMLFKEMQKYEEKCVKESQVEKKDKKKKKTLKL